MGGGILRAVGRAVGVGLAGAQETISTAKPKPTTLLSVTPPSSSPTSSSANLPVSAVSTVNSWRSSTTSSSIDEWEAIEKDDGVTGFPERLVFGPVPSKDEVEDAVSALHHVFSPGTRTQMDEDIFSSSQSKDLLGQMTNSTSSIPRIFSAESQSNWRDHARHIYDTALQSQGITGVLDAFQLLHTNSTVQRMVVSLSSDEALWYAVMNNEAVQEFKESFYAAKQESLPNSKADSHDATNLLRWIVDSTKEMIKGLIGSIKELVDNLFRPQEKGKPSDIFEDAVRSSFMLSIMVLLVVVMTRVQNA